MKAKLKIEFLDMETEIPMDWDDEPSKNSDSEEIAKQVCEIMSRHENKMGNPNYGIPYLTVYLLVDPRIEARCHLDISEGGDFLYALRTPSQVAKKIGLTLPSE